MELIEDATEYSCAHDRTWFEHDMIGLYTIGKDIRIAW